ncbi:Putative LOC100908673, partial [Caligus rogercresseyi]
PRKHGVNGAASIIYEKDFLIINPGLSFEVSGKYVVDGVAAKLYSEEKGLPKSGSRDISSLGIHNSEFYQGSGSCAIENGCGELG